MGSRKKQKANNEAKPDDSHPSSDPSNSAEAAPETSIQPEASSQSVDVPTAPSLESSTTPAGTTGDTDRLSTSVPTGSVTESSVANRKSWYGSWRGKAKPVAEVARDSVPASPTTSITNKPSVSERRKSIPNTPSPRRIMSGTGRPQGKANAIPASISKFSVTSNGLSEHKEEEAIVDDPQKKTQDDGVPTVDPPLPPEPVISQTQDPPQDKKPAEQPQPSAGWFGWWSRPDGFVEKSSTDGANDTKEEDINAAKQIPLPGLSPLDERTQPKLSQDTAKQTKTDAKAGEQGSIKKPAENARSSWFWGWSTQQNALASPTAEREERLPQAQEFLTKPPPADVNVPVPPVVVPSDIQTARDGTNSSIRSVEKKKSSGWAFWSTEISSPDALGDVHKQVGELAVANTPSQTNPEAAQFNEQEEAVPKEPPKSIVKEAPKSIARSLRGRTRIQGQDSGSASSTPAKTTPSHSPTRKPAESAKQLKEEPNKDPNLLLPAFRNTYSHAQQPTLLQQLRQYFIGDEISTTHLHITSKPPRIKKAVAIGIHGFFPSPLFQKVLGQPTGTSIRFANNAASAIKSWTEERGYECEIEKIALEGEGFIQDRVDTLWKLLLNWIEKIRDADLILVACHSQGVPVSTVLVAKLIAFGCVSSTRIGLCAMAGVNLGPFAEYKTRMFGGSALELFEFANPNSKVSQMYENALEEVLKFGVRVVYIGSIDDQLVSLEVSSSLRSQNYQDIVKN
jgi:hypothetical protein